MDGSSRWISRNVATTLGSPTSSSKYPKALRNKPSSFEKSVLRRFRIEPPDSSSGGFWGERGSRKKFEGRKKRKRRGRDSNPQPPDRQGPPAKFLNSLRETECALVSLLTTAHRLQGFESIARGSV